ncbi:MAG: ABC transporter ATP-binding protein [Patescibacteria group bacterium]
MEKAVVINNLWKKYKIGQPKKLGDALPLFLFRQKLKEFWALKNINLSVEKGERLGIIGPNGSGKSTLLKIISGVTSPSSGNFTTNGKVAALLEVGTGFHPDFTGRENIYLYGTILGMNLNEIKQRFDEIVRFSGIRKFLDTPVKYYSSGMYIRLAFSVAIHLEWDILLVDEVLAVGDIEFQKKCLLKIEKSLGSEKSLILVSHNFDIVRKLCNEVLFLENGQIKKNGKANSVVDYYLKHVQG